MRVRSDVAARNRDGAAGRQLEDLIRRAGFSAWAGVDEAGRGAAAGPLVVAAVVLDGQSSIAGLRDSKLTRAPERERLHELICAGAVAVAVVVVSVAEIDDRGVHVANLAGMRRALARIDRPFDFAVADGFCPRGLGVPAIGVWHGDRACSVVAAASIVAKVTRDRIMDEADRTFPAYGLADNKGYLTTSHLERLETLGPCRWHRRSFAPVRRLLSSAMTCA